MAAIIIDGFDNVDDNISTGLAGPGDTLVSSTFGGNDVVSPFQAQFLIHFGEGNDRLNGGYNGGTAWGEAGDDRLWSNAYSGTHNLYGGDGNDDIWPYLGTDSTAVANGYGGAGHDLLREATPVGMINNWFGGSGFDVVLGYGSTGLALVLNGTGSTGGATGSTYQGVEGATGAQGNDTLTGSRFDNLLIGGAGSDILSGDAGDDFLIGEARGVDFIQAYRGIKGDFATVNAFDPLNCNAAGAYASDSGTLNDSLFGGAGSDVLSGGDGADLLNGGTGADWATYLSAPGGVTLSLQTGGTGGHAAGDVYAFVENVQGSDSDDVIAGNSGHNELRGMGGQDNLDGRAGNDTLTGGEGRDTLTGGTGSDLLTGGNYEDTFVFGRGSMNGVDTITDMAVNHDEIWLSRGLYKGIGTVGGAIDAAVFVLGTGALDGADRVIYDDTTGALWYDADGSGVGAAVQFAQLGAGLALTANDFVVIA